MRLRLYNRDTLVAEQVGDCIVKVPGLVQDMYPISLFGTRLNKVSVDRFFKYWVAETKMPDDTRTDIDWILKMYNVKENTPIDWIHATQCKTLEDDFWVQDLDYVEG